MKRSIKFIVGFIFVFIIGLFLVIRNLTETNNGKIDMYVALNLQIDKLINPKSIEEKSIEEIRSYLNMNSKKFSKKSIQFNVIEDKNIEVNSNKIPVRIYKPESDTKLPIIIYSHGGSWIAGNIDTHDNVCRKISQNTKAIVISVDYGLAPEHPFPKGVTDVYNTMEWVYKNAASINGDEKNIALVGDSAGGNITAVVSLMTRDRKIYNIACQVLIYPSTNIFELNTKSWSYFADKFSTSKQEMEKYISLYVPRKEERKKPYVSPLLDENSEGLPNTLVITAEIDPLRDEGEAYGNKLKEMGIDVEMIRFNGVTHGFITMDKITPKADEALKQVSLYLKKEFDKNKE
ncbi:alpha/beta hydrolase [Clostridium weizhouense]|uniref:Alpha/beta hydrolase n=1 Tax=Clostridium weizhouense TaxID=2859781 RepID=A0ABS7ALR1_9CLOT|nr:alpha/beta hydrolase [Clostridium weizhouense]MBW6409600.1 alpha/beta hydrolase [Clostridium weizhouense]